MGGGGEGLPATPWGHDPRPTRIAFDLGAPDCARLTAHPNDSAEFFNRRWLDYTGLSAKQALGWGWTAAIQPADQSRLIDCERSILTSGEPGEIDARL
jgi:hypothetical protein